MKNLAIIEVGGDGTYSVYSKEPVGKYLFGGYGDTIEAAKKDYLLCIDDMRKMAKEEGEDFPENIEVVFECDLVSFFESFPWINVSAFARLAGINESQMRQYCIGKKLAGEKTLKKITEAAQKAGTDLCAVRLC